MDKKQVYIIVEGRTDVEVWESLLNKPSEVSIYYVISGGIMSIVSTANTLLEIKRNINILIIVDADDNTYYKGKKEKEAILNNYIHSKLNNNMVKIILLSPDLEGAILNVDPNEKEKRKWLIKKGYKSFTEQNESQIKKNQYVITVQKWLDKIVSSN